MARQEITTASNPGTIPVACALTSADLAAQTRRWQHLAAWAMTERTETADGLRICFRSEPGAEDELHKLVAVENGCCPWAAWTVHRAAAQAVLEVYSAGEGIAALHSMFTELQPARATHRDGNDCLRPSEWAGAVSFLVSFMFVYLRRPEVTAEPGSRHRDENGQS